MCRKFCGVFNFGVFVDDKDAQFSTEFGNTDQNITIDISRNTDLKY